MSLKLEVHRQFVSEYKFLAENAEPDELLYCTGLITDLALKKLPQHAMEQLPRAPTHLMHIAMNILAEPPPKQITAEYGESLATLLKARFPFKNISPELAEEALEETRKDKDETSVCCDLLKAYVINEQLVIGGVKWTEMKHLVDNLTPFLLNNVIDQLYREYLNREDTVSGFALHVLLKMAFNENHILPKDWDCPIEELDASIKACISNIANINQPLHLIEVVFFDKESTLYKFIDRKVLFPCVIETLCGTEFEDWDDKAGIILTLFEELKKPSQILFATSLSTSLNDPVTKSIGKCALNALSAKKPEDAGPFFDHLRELIPYIDTKKVFHEDTETSGP